MLNLFIPVKGENIFEHKQQRVLTLTNNKKLAGVSGTLKCSGPDCQPGF